MGRIEIVSVVMLLCGWIMSRNSSNQHIKVDDKSESQMTEKESLSYQIETLFSYKLQDAFRRGLDDNQWYFQIDLTTQKFQNIQIILLSVSQRAINN